MKLSHLFNTTFEHDIKGIVSHTNDIKKDYLFFLLPSAEYLFNDLIGEAIKKEAAAIVSTRAISAPIATIKVENIYEELNRTLDLFYNYPFKRAKLIGITGTDGKTTTACYISYMLNNLGCGLIGSSGIYIHKPHKTKMADSNLTTPVLTDIYKYADLIVNQGCKYLCLEASSLGIINHRIDHLRFDYTIFTNLSNENLDTFETIHDYFNSKFKLFSQVKNDGTTIVNGDDPYFDYFKDLPNVISFGQKEHNHYRFHNIRQHQGLLTFDLDTPFGSFYELYINRYQLYNLYNVLPSLIIAINEGYDTLSILHKITTLPKIDGTTEKIFHLEKGPIYIEYAQTPHALSCALGEIKKTTSNHLIVVCELANSHDNTKYPKIGQAVSEVADYVVFTTEDETTKDNLTSINSTAISSHNFVKISNRLEALRHAVTKLEDGDTLVIASKNNKNRSFLYEECSVILVEEPLFKREEHI